MQQVSAVFGELIGLGVVIGLPLWFTLWLSKRNLKQGNEYFRHFAEEHSWRFVTINQQRLMHMRSNIISPFDMDPITQLLYIADSNTTVSTYAQRYVNGERDGFNITIADPIVQYSYAVAGNRNPGKFMFLLHIPLNSMEPYLAIPDRVPLECFRLSKPNLPARVVQGYSVYGTPQLGIEDLIRLLGNSSVQFVHLIVSEQSLYLATPYRPDLNQFVDLGVAVAKLLNT